MAVAGKPQVAGQGTEIPLTVDEAFYRRREPQAQEITVDRNPHFFPEYPG
jgi:hypothetical protein